MAFRSSKTACFMLVCLLVFCAGSARADESLPFLVKPYIQMGDKPGLSDPERLTLMWQTEDTENAWTVKTKTDGDKKWHEAGSPQMQIVDLPPHKPRRFFTETLKDLLPGKSFTYRVEKDGAPVFEASVQARKRPDQPCRFVVFGDCGSGSRAQRQVAYQTYLAKPDFVLIPGDIVYLHGTLTDYILNFFPAYNSLQASPETGAPLLRSTLFVAAPGNHDLDITGGALGRDLGMFPDGLAYFYLWSQPLNGPTAETGGPNTPVLLGPQLNQKRFLSVAGSRYPRMTNFSFDYGCAHYLILDADMYMDWTDPALRQWVEEDLKSAQKALWRFVCFHQPGFNSDPGHMREQRMRWLCDIFERQQVDVVFNGHSHNYQRTYPLRFKAQKQPDGSILSPEGEVAGNWSLDKMFNGESATKPNGVIYLVSGAGGAHLSGSFQAADPSTWQDFTCRFISHPHSFTVCDLDQNELTVRQISRTGEELDRFKISK